MKRGRGGVDGDEGRDRRKWRGSGRGRKKEGE